MCAHHLDENGIIIENLIPGLRYINRPYIIRGQELQAFLEFLENLKNAVRSRPRLEKINNLTNVEFHCLFSLNKQ